MLRVLLGSCKRVCGSLPKVTGLGATALPQLQLAAPSLLSRFSTLTSSSRLLPMGFSVLQNRPLLEPKIPDLTPTRTLIKYSLQKGKRKSVKAVLKRFYRLDWGIWIRTKCGRHKHIYKKSWQRRKRLRQHVFTNATQSWLLDTMVTRYWRQPRHYPDDPYNPYHKREEFPRTRKSPQVPEVAS